LTGYSIQNYPETRNCSVILVIIHDIFLDSSKLESYSQVKRSFIARCTLDDLVSLQQKLNSDPELRTQFLNQPASFLQKAGLQMFPDQAQKLTDSLTSWTGKQSIARSPSIVILKIDGQ
jgi:hypothetical protein